MSLLIQRQPTDLQPGLLRAGLWFSINEILDVGRASGPVSSPVSEAHDRVVPLSSCSQRLPIFPHCEAGGDLPGGP